MANPTLADPTLAADDDENLSFSDLGLDARLLRSLIKKSITNPTPIQRVAIPLILQGKDVVARAKTGSGKTFAYLLPMVQKILVECDAMKSVALSSIVLVPTRELCQQVYVEITSLVELCRVSVKVVQLTSSMATSDLKTAVSGQPDVIISTPACVQTCLSNGILQGQAIQASLSTLVLDEADLLLSYGYENDLKALTALVPRNCQCLLMSATSSADVEKLKKLVLHNPYILTLPEVGDEKDDIIPKNVQQFSISCSARDKFVSILALLKLELVQRKVLIFTNTIDMGFTLKLFLEKFGIKSAVLNAELPQNSRLHILEVFNAGHFDYLIASDDGQSNPKEQDEGEYKTEGKKSRKRSKRKLDSEFGVVRGIDFKYVHTVINFEMPHSAEGYVHRIGRTGRGYSTGASVSLVSPGEMVIFEEIKSTLGEEAGDGNFIAPFPLLTQSAVESLRYRAEDIARSVTKVDVREARAQDLRNEILNSDKLKAHFQHNPRDLDLLKHDKSLSKKPPPAHLRHVPEYMFDQTTQEASKMVKLARLAMGNTSSDRPLGPKKKFRRSKNPLKTFSAKGPKRNNRSFKKRK